MSKGDIAMFKRYAPGLYVDSTETWVITRDQDATSTHKATYTVRQCEGLGYLLDGITLFPDYGNMIWAQTTTLTQAKQAVSNLLTRGW